MVFIIYNSINIISRFCDMDFVLTNKDEVKLRRWEVLDYLPLQDWWPGWAFWGTSMQGKLQKKFLSSYFLIFYFCICIIQHVQWTALPTFKSV